MSEVADRIPEEVLAEQWYRFMHRLIGDLRSAYHQANSRDETTQKKMAARLGRKPSFISRCLSGQQNMTVRTIHDLARSMGCRLELVFRPLADVTPSNRAAHLASVARETLDQTVSPGQAELVQLFPDDSSAGAATTRGTSVKIFAHAA